MSWPIVTLSDHCQTITKGTTPTTLGFDFSSYGIPFVRVQNIVDGSIQLQSDDLYISEKTHNALARSRIMPGDVLVSIAGTIGRAAIVPDDFNELNCNQAVAIIRISRGLDRRFFLHWLNSKSAIEQIRQSKVTATISNLSLGQIGGLQIPLPPLDEQKRIAAILDQADALRRQRQQSIDRLNDLGQSLYHDLLSRQTTQKMALGELCLPISTWNPRYTAGPSFNYVDIGSLDQKSKQIMGSKPIERLNSPSRARQIIKTDDVLVSTVRPNLNAVGRVTQGLDGSTASTGFCVLRPRTDKTTSQFLFYLVRSPAFIKAMVDQATGASYPAVSDKIIKNYFAPKIKLDEQLNFSKSVEKIENLSQANMQNLRQLNSLFSSLQHRAFRGELISKDAERELLRAS